MQNAPLARERERERERDRERDRLAGSVVVDNI